MDIPTYAKFLLITDYIPGAILDVQYWNTIHKPILPNFFKKLMLIMVCPKFHS